MIYKKIDGNSAEIRLYGNIGSWFSDGKTFMNIMDEVEREGIKSVILRMHCYGGSVFEGNVIGNILKRSKLDIKIAIDGIAASMGCFILPYLPIEKISISQNAFGMLHRPSSWIEGDADDLKNEVKLLEDIEKFFIESLSKRTGKTKEEIKTTYFDGKDHWLNAEEMLSLKLVGKITDKVSEIEILDKEILGSLDIETVYGKFAAKLNSNIKNNTMDNNLLISTFGLKEVTGESSDTVILSKLQEKINNLTNENQRLQESAKAAVTKEINLLIDTAIEEKRIVVDGKNVETVKNSFRKVGEDSGIEALKNLIDAIPTQTQTQTQTQASSISSQIQKDENSGSQVKTFEWYRENNLTALKEMETKEPEKFKELYKNEFGVYPKGN